MFRSFRSRVPLTAVLSLVLVSPALAQTSSAPDWQSPAASPTGPAAWQSEIPGSATDISRRQIAGSSAQDAEDLLSGVPNVNELGYSADSEPPPSNSIAMRGLGGGAREGGISRALVTLDGVPLNDPFFGYIQWSRAPLDDIDRIQIVRGGESTLWGNYAEGGVIAITTQTDARDTAALNGGRGSFGAYRGSASGAYRTGDDNILQAVFEAQGTDGYPQIRLYHPVSFIVPTTSGAANLHVKDSFSPTPQLTAQLSLSYHDDRQRFQTPLDTNGQRNVDLSGNLARRLGDDGILSLTLYYGDSAFDSKNSFYTLDTFNPFPPTEKANEAHHVRAQDAGGSLVWSEQLSGDLDWLIGMDWHYISGDDRTDHRFLPDHSRGFAVTRGGGDQLFTAGFAQASLSPVGHLKITAGGRIQLLRDSNGYDGSFGGLGDIPSRTYAFFEPRVDARYSLPAGFALRAAYYRSYRAPNLGDLFYSHASGLFVQLPNPLLKPEEMTGGEAGLDFARSGFHSQITLYRMEIGNDIVIGKATNAVYAAHGWYMTQNQNAASVRAQGIEAEADWDIGWGFTANLDYTLADSIVTRNPLDPRTVGQQLMDVPRRSEAAELAYGFAQGGRISVEAQYIGKASFFSLVLNDGEAPYRSWAKSNLAVDLAVSYPLGRNAELYASARNLLDRRYMAVGYSAPSSSVVLGPPREIFAGLRMTLD